MTKSPNEVPMKDDGHLDKKIEELRHQYALEALNEEEVAGHPMDQLRYWLNEALEAEVQEPNAMTLATADAKGRPSARIVLVRRMEDDGPVFFTNYRSRKGRELAENPYACGNFFWPELQRQVRLEGKVERIDPEGSDAYFNSRPYKSRIGAWASEQSQVLPSREALEERFKELEEQFPDKGPERPEFWGGYRLIIERAEFWQGRPDRLHDRIELEQEGEGWSKKRLSP